MKYFVLIVLILICASAPSAGHPSCHSHNLVKHCH